MKLENKVAVITGAGSGMGRAIAVLFAKEGAKVIAADLNEESVQSVVKEITETGGEATAVVTNVAKEEDINVMIDTAVEKYGTLDILVNNAGIMDNFVPAKDLSNELWERVLAVNTTGPMFAIRKVLPLFLEKKSGVIINNASIGGLFGSRAGAAYTASKHAVIGLTKNVGFQYANEGIRCNAIAPGGVNTNIGTTMSEPNPFGMERAMSGAVNNPRSGESEEIATVALFLASEDSSFVNGQVITADGGWTAY
ncbi:SDR family oxidoreductase [Neobacillus citreus]|uniref:SDR family oxidoreductase n=1 Tax=Neobacillus citreus TaxID=2833578 RepID=A0A942T4U5_9BACI|nr:SDR family oxidoreductase [Neobacillus citreus]MCH6267139.1 SDR family oxidoreductase [Neobacillus citreus]